MLLNYLTPRDQDSSHGDQNLRAIYRERSHFGLGVEYRTAPRDNGVRSSENDSRARIQIPNFTRRAILICASRAGGREGDSV